MFPTSPHAINIIMMIHMNDYKLLSNYIHTKRVKFTEFHSFQTKLHIQVA